MLRMDALARPNSGVTQSSWVAQEQGLTYGATVLA